MLEYNRTTSEYIPCHFPGALLILVGGMVQYHDIAWTSIYPQSQKSEFHQVLILPGPKTCHHFLEAFATSKT